MMNPYQAPVEAHGQPNAKARSDSHANQYLGGRLSIIFVAFIFGAVSAFSLFGFLYDLTMNYPETDRPVIAVAPIWMLGHVLRGLGLGVLTWFMWKYQLTIRKCRSPTAEGAQQLIVVHNKMWKTGALVLGALVVYAFVYVAITRYGFEPPSFGESR